MNRQQYSLTSKSNNPATGDTNPARGSSMIMPASGAINNMPVSRALRCPLLGRSVPTRGLPVHPGPPNCSVKPAFQAISTPFSRASISATFSMVTVTNFWGFSLCSLLERSIPSLGVSALLLRGLSLCPL